MEYVNGTTISFNETCRYEINANFVGSQQQDMRDIMNAFLSILYQDLIRI